MMPHLLQACRRSFAALLGVALLAVPAASQQAGDGVLRGTVENDGEPVPGIEVTLHRVRSEQAGAIASATADDAGRFEFDLPPADPEAFNVYFTTVEFEGARYFGRAVHPGETGDEYTIVTYDSASVAPFPVRMSRRDMMIVSQPDGAWEVDEVVRIHNPNTVTLLGSGGLPSWEFRIPEGAESFEVGEGEVPANQVQRMGPRVLLSIPLVPGTRDVYVRYRIPGAADVAVLPFESPADTFNLFVRQPSPTVSVVGLTSTNLIQVEDQEFLQYSGLNLPADSEVRIEWESVAPPVDPVWAAVGVSVLLLLVGALAAARGARPTPPAGGAVQRTATPDLAVGRAE